MRTDDFKAFEETRRTWQRDLHKRLRQWTAGHALRRQVLQQTSYSDQPRAVLQDDVAPKGDSRIADSKH